MPFSATPRSLIVYCSPGTMDRLRLDKEHKAIDSVIAKHSLGENVIRRIHAPTLLDVATALREQDYELIQFSGHGNCNGLYLEGEADESLVPWSVLARTLIQAAPSLSVTILTTCHSSEAETEMLKAAPYVVMIRGDAHDTAAIKFSEHFFDEFYRSTAVDQAFGYATNILEVLNLANTIMPVLARRQTAGGSLIQACFDRRRNSIYIDLGEAESCIANLPIPRQDFLSLLTRKIRIHQWIFRYPRERAVLQIGELFGVFSWQNANDVVKCHEVLQLRPNTTPEICLGWTRLLVIYNDLRSERYRALDHPSSPENRSILAQAIGSVESCWRHVLAGDDVAKAARSLAPILYDITCANVRVHCDRARTKLKAQELPEVVVSLETAISAIHDLVDELTSAVTTAPQQHKGSAKQHAAGHSRRF